MRLRMTATGTERLLRALARAPLVPESLLRGTIRLDAELTSRERETLAYLSHGLTLEMAAQAMGVGRETVRVHSDTARFKLRAKNRTHAVAQAIRGGIIP